ncbi:MAG: RNA methyltransferase [Cyanobacteriota bacterium]
MVLVEPAGPLNVGSVARLCANYAVPELRLVAPRCDPLADEARRMAVHGVHLLEQARQFPSLAAAIADCRRVVAASGREGGATTPLPPEEALAWLRTPAEGPAAVALVFGREDRGLDSQELGQAGRLLRIPTPPGYGSLNLSHAVAVCLAAGQRTLAGMEGPASQAMAGGPLPPRQAVEDLLADAEELLEEVGFLQPHTARARMAGVRELLRRAEALPGELALLRGMVHQLRWACRRGSDGGSG